MTPSVADNAPSLDLTDLSHVGNIITKKKIPRRQLISPVSLLNDYALVIKERNIFKELKGDKKLLANSAAKMSNHQYLTLTAKHVVRNSPTTAEKENPLDE